MQQKQPLRPSDIKILQALLKGEKTNKELNKLMSSKALSNSLKKLRHLDLVEHDIDSRKYKAKLPITQQTLFFNEVLELVRVQFDKSIKQGNEKAGIISGDGSYNWVVMTEAPEQNAFIEKRLKDPKNREALVTVSRIVDDSWEEYYRSTLNKNNTSIKKRMEIIEKYKRFLGEIAVEIYPLESPGQNQKDHILAQLFEKVKKEMIAAFPGIDIPKEMINLEATRRLKRYLENRKLEPKNLDSLVEMLPVFEKLENIYGTKKEDWTKEEWQVVERKLNFLKNQKNRKIYEENLDHLSRVPKSIIFYPSWGFKGYMQKLSELVPKDEKQKSQRGS